MLKTDTIAEQEEAIKDLIAAGNDEGAVRAYFEAGLGDGSDFEEAYVGEYKSDEDFAQSMAEELGSVDFKNQPWPQYCIDWEYAARELMMDYTEQDGHYFRNL